MRGAAVQPLTLPKPLNALKRHSFRHWMWRCEMARLRGFGQHDWMIPSVPAGVISVDGAKVEYNLQSTTPVAVASIIVATVHKGVDEVEVQYRDAAALVDGVLMQVDDLHKNDREAANDAHREAFREALIVRVEERLKEPRERLSTIRSPCPELLDEIGRGEDELFEVRYVDDLEGIADRILSERNINHMIFAPKGSGKTQVVMRPLANSIEDGIAVSHRVILADSAASTLKCRHYQTRDFPHEIELTGWKTYCVNSLIKPDGEREARSADCIVFDEFHGIMESIAKGRGRGSGMAEADKVFELLKRVLSNRGKPRTLMKDDKTVVMMDAGISHKDLLFARSVSKAAGKKLVLWLVQATPESKEKAHVEACLNGRGASNRKHVVIVPDEATLNALVISAHNQHPNNVIFQGSTTKLGIMASSKYVSAQDDENICLTANTKDERMVADYVRDPNQFVEKNTLWHVGLSPAGSEGLSLESARYHTDVFLSYTTNKLVSYQTVDQMSGRVRAAERVFISFGNHADDNPNAGIEDDDVERGNLRRAEVALEFVQGRPGDVEKVLDSYSTFATWYRQDIEYSRLHGKQLLMMKWKEEDYTFEYPEPIYDDWSTKEDKMAGIKCEVKEAIEQGMLDALELRGEDYKTLAGSRKLGTTEMDYMIKRRSLIRILELTPTHEYFALPGVPDEEYESLEKENAEAIKAPGAMVLGESTAKDLLKIKKRLGFSRKKRDMLYNAINGPGWALEKKDESNPTIEKEMWPLRYDISSGGFAALGLNPGGSNGVFGLKEMEAFKRFIVPRLREAKGCGMMESVKLALSYTPNKHGGGMLSDFDAEVTSDRYTARVLVKTFLREHGLSLRKVRNEDTWYIDQVLHEWVLDIFKRPVQKVAAAYFGPPLVDPRGSKTLHSIPMSQGKRAKRLRQMFEASDGVLPMIPGALVKISEKSAGDTFTRNSAGIWKRKILKDEELLEGMELEVIQVSVMKGAVGNGKRDLDVPVLAAIGSDINEVLAVVCSVFAAGSVSVKEDNPEMCRV